MINAEDFAVRGWHVIPTFAPETQMPINLLSEMDLHPEAAGKSSWGTRNVIIAFTLSTRPKLVLEIGGHIGSASVAMGHALKANNFGLLYTLEPQDHYFQLLCHFVRKAGVEEFVRPVQMLSTDAGLIDILGDKIDIIFLDANHSYSHVMKDLEVCDELLSPNGLVFLDDVGPEISKKLCA